LNQIDQFRRQKTAFSAGVDFFGEQILGFLSFDHGHSPLVKGEV